MAQQLPEAERLTKIAAGVGRIGDPLKRLDVSSALLDDVANFEAALRSHRAVAIDELREQGWTLERLAARLGVSRQRVAQLAAAPAVDQ